MSSGTNPDAEPTQIRCLLLPVQGGTLLLPNSLMAEIILYRRPEPAADTPPWLLGRIAWRNRRVPVVSLSLLAGRSQEEGDVPGNLAVIRLLGDGEEAGYMALIARGVPRIRSVGPDKIEWSGASEGGVLRTAHLEGEPVDLPDLDAIENRLAETGLLPE